ncbi:MAG: tetratricopeptide repeat protein, partial [Myxococcota bacterium]|nr:tetratricopeptide repeat protein [Myxococcota bacterium]
MAWVFASSDAGLRPPGLSSLRVGAALVRLFWSILLFLLLAAMPRLGTAVEGEDSSLGHHLAQGRFLLEAGQVREALAEFLEAVAMPEGQRDPAVHVLLARTGFAVGDLTLAIDSVRRAVALSDGEDDPELAELHEFLTTGFGKVLVVGAGSADSQSVEPVGPILDPELKRLFEQVREQLKERAESGSTSIYLPVGSYRVGSHIVVVSAGATARMDLRQGVGALGGGVFGERLEPSAAELAPP